MSCFTVKIVSYINIFQENQKPFPQEPREYFSLMKLLISFSAVVPEYFGGTSTALVMIKSYVLNKLKSTGINADVEIRLKKFFCEDKSSDIVSALSSDNASIMGFSVYPWNYLKIKEIVAELKSINPDVQIALGGPALFFEPEKVLKKWQGADIIVKGPGEETFFKLVMLHLGAGDYDGLKNITFRKKGNIYEAPYEINFCVEDQTYPLLVEDIQDLYLVYYETSRGCYFNCKFCAWNVAKTALPGIYNYPLDKVKNDLEKIFRLPLLDRLMLSDSNIMLDRDRCVRIFGYIRELNRKRSRQGLPFIRLTFDFNPQYLTDELIDELAKMNISVTGFGLQSADEKVLSIAKRKFDKQKYVSNLKKIKAKGINFILQIIFGLPGDTLEKFRKTIEFALSEVRPHSISCFRFLILPGSPFWYEKQQHGIIHEDYPYYHVISTNTFSKQDIDYADKLACWLNIIFTLFRSLKKSVEKYAFAQGLEVVPLYEQIIEKLSDKYYDFFDMGFDQNASPHYFSKLRDKKYAGLKQEMLSDGRKFFKEIK